MTTSVPHSAEHRDPSPDDPDVALTLSAEQLRVDPTWFVSGRLRLRRRVVTRTELVEVTLRREELVIEAQDATPSPAGDVYSGSGRTGEAVTAPAAAAEPIVVVLREEVPEIGTHLREYETVTATVRLVGADVDIAGTVAHEAVELTTEPLETQA